MMLKGTPLFTIFYLFILPVFAQFPIGNWREHLPYRQAFRVTAAADKIYCATPYSIFTIDLRDNSIDRLSKINGLSETGVSAIKHDEQTNKTIVAYSNSNIDVLYRNNIMMIDAVKRKTIAGDKRIYDIFCHQEKAYLSTGFGVVVIDENKYEVKDTYVIGNSGNQVRVNGFTTDGSFFYAASDEGLKTASAAGVNLSDYRNWRPVSDPVLATTPCTAVLNVQNRIMVQKGDSIFVMNANTWKLLYTGGWSITNANSSAGKLLISEKRSTGESRVVILNPDGLVVRTIERNNITDPQHAIEWKNEIWIADLSGGLIRSSGNSFQQYQPQSPFSITTGEMVARSDVLWATPGGVTNDWTNTFSKGGLSRFAGQEWSNFTTPEIPAFDSLYDLVAIAVDPRDNSIWSGSFGGGLLHLNSRNSLKVYKQDSPLETPPFNHGYYRVSGLAFDGEHNLWISNYGASQNIAVLKKDGSWKKFSAPVTLADQAVSQVIVDDINQKWIVSPNGNGLICFNNGSSIENTGDDRWKFYRSGTGNGNLPDNRVLCIDKDRNGFIWVGTMRGIGVIQCPGEVFTNQGCEAILPVVQQDNFAGYLFRDEEVQAIVTDGADRKWIGTKNGVWLISPDGEKTIHHFREENSPLLSDDVRKITIDQRSGEVYFATAKGICSFRGDATEGGSVNADVLVFPNPVPPGYSGTIGIKGLVNNALVKITELDGRLVYQTRAFGGQATWNGINYKGQKISTGVYLVIVSDDKRQEKMVAKIVYVR